MSDFSKELARTGTLKEGEHFVGLIHEHWMVFVVAVFLDLVAVLFSALVLVVSVEAFLQGFSWAWVGLLVGALFLLTVTHWFFIYFTSLRLSGWALTTERFINFEFRPFVRRNMTYFALNDIKEIEKHQNGFVRNFLHYGDLTIHMTANPEPIHCHLVGRPGRLLHLITVLQKKTSWTEEEVGALREQFVDLLG